MRSSESTGQDDGYGLEADALEPPPLPGTVVVRAGADELIDCVAADLVVHAENCVREFGDFHIALSGGAVFEPLYRRLMYDPNYRRIPWRRTHLWFVVERCMPFEEPGSVFRQISETLGDHADIPPEQFHPIFAEKVTAAADYETLLREVLAWREKGQDRLDYVLLTTDASGATAGIYADGALEDTGPELVRRSLRPRDPETNAVTLTPQLINAARFIAVLVTGAEAAPTLQRLADAPDACGDLPIHAIAPLNGEMTWYLDGPASGGEKATP
ncbi:MAG: hypothetical protein HKO59_11495 [Phycisphaerales bacterium]|nr:6-phosphogluconolactonase [Phycisphaerae bacterium]NNF41925.1 hypothetical protein [Phycisphaerales bacterium]NNM26587.1 hypothetical protein [Phycisphaerales bacterium]